MECPRCKTTLEQVYTRRGVMVDVCPKGHGVWLDGGELFFFVKKPREVEKLLAGGLIGGDAPPLPCPRCVDAAMDNGRLGVGGPLLDMCGKCRGLWFDRDELRQLNKALGADFDPYREILEDRSGGARKSVMNRQQPVRRPAVTTSRPAPVSTAAALAARAAMSRLPNLAFGSLVVFSSLYALVFVALVAATYSLGVNIHVAAITALAVIFFQYIISPFIMDLTLGWFQSMRWVGVEQLPGPVAAFIRETSAKHGIPVPRIGIIDDGTPNAFTYGHVPSNARIVITRGLLEILDEDEAIAVVAHEMGHAVHWDILFMTLAGAVPVVLYYLYRLLSRAGSGSRKGGGYVLLVALGAYILYYISEYMVLYLSRIREYFADRYSGEQTGSPNALATALVKVAYGLAGSKPEETGGKDGEKQKARRGGLDAVKAFGIFDPTAARGLAIASAGASTPGAVDAENAAGAMQWDLWNPWAMYYEIHSTHPLPARRIHALSRQAEAYQQQPALVFNLKKPESYWDEFFVDLLVMLVPIGGLGLGAAAGLAMGAGLIPGLALIGLAAGYLLNLFFTYRSGFAPMTVAALLKNVKVSGVRPVPVTLKGRIIGRGVPGLVWSEDIVMRDETGYIFLDYRQPLRIIEFLFGLMRAGRFVGEEVVATGWYRRAPVPYVELKSVRLGNHTHTCWVYALKIVMAALMAAAGVALTFGAMVM